MKAEELKELCENDLFFLTKDVLNYDKLEEDTHLEVCEFLEGPEKRKLMLLPRDTFKTTISTIARGIQGLLKDPDIRILIFSETYNQAKKFLSELKQKLERTEQLIGIYGIFKKEPGWKEEEITIRQRTKVFKEPTIMTAGVDVVRTGFHYDLILIDDPHSQKNVSTKAQIDKVKTTYKLLLPMLDPDGEICIVGTRWHFYDLASMLLEKKKFKKMVRAAEVKNRDGTSKYFFPQRLSKAFLEEKKEDLGSYLYSCQYQNNPVDDEHADFKRSWFRYYKESDLARLLLHTFITIDPGGKAEANDFTGVIINSVDMEKNWYFRKTLKLHIDGPGLIKKLFEWNEKWHPIKIGIEKEKYSLMLKPFLTEEMEERDEYLPIVLLTPKVTNKELRIKGLSPRYEAGRIYHNSEDPNHIDLEEDLVRFPKAATDDLPDAASMQLDIAKTPKRKVVDYTQKVRGKKYYPKIGI